MKTRLKEIERADHERSAARQARSDPVEKCIRRIRTDRRTGHLTVHFREGEIVKIALLEEVLLPKV